MVMVHIVPLADQVCNKKNSTSGYIAPSARGDIFIGQQMRMLVLGLSDCEILLLSRLEDPTYHDYDIHHDIDTLHALYECMLIFIMFY